MHPLWRGFGCVTLESSFAGSNLSESRRVHVIPIAARLSCHTDETVAAQLLFRMEYLVCGKDRRSRAEI